MAYLAIHGASHVNGVSRLHGEVSRGLFNELFPGCPRADVPVGHVTNGVHVPSWDSPASEELWTDAGVRDRWRGVPTPVVERIERIPTARMWTLLNDNRERFVHWTRQRLARQLTMAGADADHIDEIRHAFDPGTLTLGFARRFTEYKRTGLLLHDPDRLARILTNAEGRYKSSLPGSRTRAIRSERNDSALVRVFAAPGAALARRISRGLRPAARRANGERGRRVGQHAAAALGSERYERHESPRQFPGPRVLEGSARPGPDSLAGWFGDDWFSGNNRVLSAPRSRGLAACDNATNCPIDRFLGTTGVSWRTIDAAHERP